MIPRLTLVCLVVVLWTGNVYTLGDTPSTPGDGGQEVLSDPLDSNFYGLDDDETDGPEEAGGFVINILGIMFGSGRPETSPFHIMPQTEAGHAIQEADDTDAELEDDDDDDGDADEQTERIDPNSVHNRTARVRPYGRRHPGRRHHGRRRHHHRRHHRILRENMATICTNAQNTTRPIPEHIMNVIQTMPAEAQASAQRKFEQMRNHVRNCCSRGAAERLQCMVNTMQERVDHVCTGQEQLPPWRLTVEQQMEIRNSCCSLQGRQRFGCFRNVMITQHRAQMPRAHGGMVNNTCARLQRPIQPRRRLRQMSDTWRTVWAQKRQALQQCCQQDGTTAIVNCFVQVRREKFNRFCSNQEQLKPWKFSAEVQNEIRQNCCSKQGDERYNCINEAKMRCHRRRHARMTAGQKLQRLCRKMQRPAPPRRRITQNLSAADTAKWQAIWTSRRTEIRECCQIESADNRLECVSDIRNNRLDSVCEGNEELFPPGRHSSNRRRRITARLRRCCALEDDARHSCFYRPFSNNTQNGSVTQDTSRIEQTPARTGAQRRQNRARRLIKMRCCAAGKQAEAPVDTTPWMRCRTQGNEYAKSVRQYKRTCKRVYTRCCVRHSRRTPSNISPTTTSP